MEHTMSKQNIFNYIMGFVFIALGLLTIFMPQESITLFATIALLLSGLTLFYRFLTVKEQRNVPSCILWILVLTLGILALISYISGTLLGRPAVVLLSLFLAVWAIVKGVYNLYDSLLKAVKQNDKWYFKLIFGLLEIALGVVILSNPAGASDVILSLTGILIGVYVMIYGAEMIVETKTFPIIY